MSLSWREHLSPLIILVAFVPFLVILFKAKIERSSASKVFTRLLPGFLLFNIITFSWLGKVSIAGATMAILAHSFLMSFTLCLLYLVYQKASELTAAISFISFWLGYEYLCLKISIISPWLNTGNVFGKEPGLIQWYEYTGAGGGTLWVLLVNLLIFKALVKPHKSRARMLKHLLPALGMILLPIIISVITGAQFSESTPAERVVIVQPNVDPYTQKFDSLPFFTQLDDMLSLTDGKIDKSTRWLVFPETAIDDPFDESEADNNRYISRIKKYFSEYDSLNIILGATTTAINIDDNPRDIKSGMERGTIYSFRELYNSAVHFGKDSEILFYHKSKLVPGFEKKVSFLPPFLERIIIPDLGGTMSGYGIQNEREVFTHTTGRTKAAPVICYESAYGEFTTQYIHKGAGFIAIITNDGWWKNTPAYKQHLWFASLRAIENRRPVVRSANTGISCIINKKGIITESLPWWEEGVLVSDIFPGETSTLYAAHGDIIYRYSAFASLVILILAFIAAPIRNIQRMQLL